MKICEVCKNVISSIYGSGRFCDSFCAKKFATLQKRKAINEAVSKKAIERFKRKEFSGCIKERTKSKKKTCPICSCEFEFWVSQKRIYCSKQCMDNDVNHEFKKKAMGGYRENSGRSKKGYYKGIWCHSTYELVYILYNLENGITFERNRKGYEYCKNGVIHKYYPDFIEGDTVVEIKGYYSPDVDLKSECVKSPFKILYKKDLGYAFKYIKNKYNKDVHRIFELYDDYSPQYSYVCNNCGCKFSNNKNKTTKEVFCSRICAGLFRKYVIKTQK